jgi:hypothetical protein
MDATYIINGLEKTNFPFQEEALTLLSSTLNYRYSAMLWINSGYMR